MAKKQKIGRTWIRRSRKIDGKDKMVYVRKIDGKYQTRTHKPEVHGIALANKIHSQRPKKNQNLDEKRTNKDKRRPTDKNLKSFRKNAGAFDIKTVDTKK